MSHASILVAVDPTDNVEEAVAYQMEPFDENGEWFAEGSRWDWWVIGGRYSGRLSDNDVLRRGDIDLGQLKIRDEARLRLSYEEAMKMDERLRGLLYDISPGESMADYLAKRERPFPAHYAFLRNRCWQEHDRLGWFGSATATECELKGADTHICRFEKDGARVVSWGDSDSWDKMFFARFVEPLPPETLLVTVDYHV